MKVKLIRYTEKPLEAIASAAAITRGITYDEYIKSGKDPKKLIQHCYESGHWSVFEFADFDFEVEGASRVFETQCVRSRLASYEWESGRHDQEYEPCSHVPKSVITSIYDGIFSYDVLSSTHKPEIARYTLPQGVARKARIKRNFRNLMETAMIRLCTKAQAEYRVFMSECKTLVAAVDPYLASLLVPKCQVYLYCNENEPCGDTISKKEAQGLIDKAKLH